MFPCRRHAVSDEQLVACVALVFDYSADSAFVEAIVPQQDSNVCSSISKKIATKRTNAFNAMVAQVFQADCEAANIEKRPPLPTTAKNAAEQAKKQQEALDTWCAAVPSSFKVCASV